MCFRAILLRVGQIPNQRAARGNRKLLILKAHLLDRFPEMRFQAFRCVSDRANVSLLSWLAIARQLVSSARNASRSLTTISLGSIPRQLVRHGNARIRNLIEIEFAWSTHRTVRSPPDYGEGIWKGCSLVFHLRGYSIR